MTTKRKKKPTTPDAFREAEDREIDRALEKLDDQPVLEVDDIDIVEVEPTPPQLTREELFALQLAQFQARAYDAELQLEIIKRDAYLKQVDPQGQIARMAAFIRGRADEAATAKTAYAEAKKKIEERLKIDLKEWAYDDQTGLLTKVDQ